MRDWSEVVSIFQGEKFWRLVLQEREHPEHYRTVYFAMVTFTVMCILSQFLKIQN